MLFACDNLLDMDGPRERLRVVRGTTLDMVVGSVFIY